MGYIVKKEPDNEGKLHCLSRGGASARFSSMITSLCNFGVTLPSCNFVVMSSSCDFVVMSPLSVFVVMSPS
jgi:hypothetical protein